MKNSQHQRSRARKKRTRLFRIALLVLALFAIGVATAIAKYKKPAAKAAASSDPFVTVDVGGKKLRVNAFKLQQGPLTQDESQSIVDALKNNKSTEGLVQVQHPDGTVEMDLQGRFQSVMLAKRNDDGSITTGCVDNSEAAKAFLENSQTQTPSGDTPVRKAALQ